MILFGAAAALSAAGDFEIAWHTIDSGGVLRSVGGDFELSGTIGQPDAGILSGGDITLGGGFWFAIPPTDCNDDGLVDLLDHQALTQCLDGPDAGVSAGCQCFDVDRNGTVDLSDFAVAQAAHNGP